MKRTFSKCISMLLAAAILSGCSATAEMGSSQVETIISETGSGETYFDPPETMPLSDGTLTYQYTAELPGVIDESPNAEVRINYYYAAPSESLYTFDAFGRLVGYINTERTDDYAVSVLSEDNCMEQTEIFMSDSAIDRTFFPECTYTPDDRGAEVLYTRNTGEPYQSTMRFRYNSDGILTSMTALYSDVDSLSNTDYTTLANQVEDMIGISENAGLSYTIEGEQVYLLNNTLYYQASVTFMDENGAAFTEIYTAGKPIE